MEGDLHLWRTVWYMADFNPLPPHGGRPFPRCHNRSGIHFNPLPPHGGRQNRTLPSGAATIFQSTPSAWRETTVQVSPPQCDTHFNPLPPHGGRPDLPCSLSGQIVYFNPLPPHGGRLITVEIFPFVRNFNPLPPHGGRLR